MGRRAVGGAIGIVATWLSASCGSPPPPAPSAVITASPESVCIGDDETTKITLDATRSSPNLSLVYEKPAPDEPPLQFTWSFAGSHYLIDTGDEHAATLTLYMTADRPLHVTLRVQNGAGGVTEALTTISVTPLADDGTCPLPAAE